MDFVVGLPDAGDDDQILTVMCKSTKHVTFIAGHNIYTARDWALALLEQL